MDTYQLASSIVLRLREFGFEAYFAGGFVRDYLLSIPSEDIDIATSARPEEVVKLFEKTLLVGARFGVVIVILGMHQFEVSTYRKDEEYEDGRRPKRISHSTLEEDAKRRDFTINGLYLDPIGDHVFDYVGGISDLKNKRLKTIGDPYERFLEDRLRMVRAARFQAKFDLSIDPSLCDAAKKLATSLFPAVAKERVWQELKKMEQTKRFEKALISLFEMHLLQEIFWPLKEISLEEMKERARLFPYFPKEASLPFYFPLLFPEETKESIDEMLVLYRASGKERALFSFVFDSFALLKGTPQKHDLVRFYANTFSEVVLSIFALQLDEEKRVSFIEQHERDRRRLKEHIKREILGSPIVTAAHLMKEGVNPSKKMGELLKEAEFLAIDFDIHDPSLLIDKLKEHPLWPK